MTDLLSTPVVSKLVGVVDLKDGQAVHAVAGVRNEYKSVQFCDGDPKVLVEHYLRKGITEFYVADLDAIIGGSIQRDLLHLLCSRIGNCPVLLDVGWPGMGASKIDRGRAKSISELATAFPSTQWIAATESARSLDVLHDLAQLVPARRILIGFDYRNGELIGKHRVEDWIEAGLRFQVAGSVILDLAQVGAQSGPTTGPDCQLVKKKAPNWTIYSGGGIRNSLDVNGLIQAGCARCLVGTALHCIV